tara:strand:- start:1604 stop:2452 length:849 start_codon:yes stop_codon:yes gene_type:complete
MARLVHFLFKGTDSGVADARIRIPQDVLESFRDGETFLAKKNAPEWLDSTEEDEEEKPGQSEASAIEIDPLAALSECWHPAAAPLIAACYAGVESLVLPDGVELEELLGVLDYFGLTPAGGGESVNLESCSTSARMRANNFLLLRKTYVSALDAVKKVLKTPAAVIEVRFVAYDSNQCIYKMNKFASFKNHRAFAVCAPGRRAPVTNDVWAGSAYYRGLMQQEISELDDELEVSWKVTLCMWEPEDYGHYEDGRPSNRYANLQVFAIKAPAAVAIAKRRVAL